MSKLISAIIPSYNSASFLAEAIESVLAQTYQPIEVIVVNDGSTDETPAVVRPYLRRIKYIEQPNQGLSAARNRGIRESAGSLIAFLDADDRWAPEKAAKQVDCLLGNSAAALVHCDCYYWEPAAGRAEVRDRNRQRYVGNCYRQLFHANVIPPSTVMLHRRCLDEVGLFDETIRRPTSQDYDLWLRLARRYEFAYIDEPLIHYRIHEANASRNLAMMREDDLRVLENAMAADPQLEPLVGEKIASRRLAQLAFIVGYTYFQRGDFPPARQYLWRSLRRRPRQVYAAGLYLAAHCPPHFVSQMRAVKRTLMHRWRASDAERDSIQAASLDGRPAERREPAA